MVPKSQQQFESLLAQFDVLERDLRECQISEQRWVLLEDMIRLLEEIDRLISEQLADSQVSATPAEPSPKARSLSAPVKSDPPRS